MFSGWNHYSDKAKQRPSLPVRRWKCKRSFEKLESRIALSVNTGSVDTESIRQELVEAIESESVRVAEAVAYEQVAEVVSARVSRVQNRVQATLTSQGSLEQPVSFQESRLDSSLAESRIFEASSEGAWESMSSQEFSTSRAVRAKTLGEPPGLSQTFLSSSASTTAATLSATQTSLAVTEPATAAVSALTSGALIVEENAIDTVSMEPQTEASAPVSAIQEHVDAFMASENAVYATTGARSLTRFDNPEEFESHYLNIRLQELRKRADILEEVSVASSEANLEVPTDEVADAVVVNIVQAGLQTGSAQGNAVSITPREVVSESLASVVSLTSLVSYVDYETQLVSAEVSYLVDPVFFSDGFDITVEDLLSDSSDLGEVEETEYAVSRVPAEGFVDITSFLNEFSFEEDAVDNPTDVAKEVNKFLSDLHTPPSRKVVPDDIDVIDESDTGVVDDDKTSEGGMVLLQNVQGKADADLYVVDEAFAALDDLLDDNVRMRSSMGAYQAFDVGTPLGAVVDEPVSHVRPVRSGADKSSEGIRSKGVQTTSISSQAASGLLATAAAAITLKLNHRNRRKPQAS